MIDTLEPILAEHPFLKDLPADYLGLLTGCASNVRFEGGAYVFREGEEANNFYLLRQGKVAIQIAAGPRGPVAIQTLSAGDVLGWSWLIPPHRWRFDAQALEPTRAVALDGKCLRGKCEKNHDLGYELLKRFSALVAGQLEATRLRLLDVYGLHD
jgi:CRP/FNR family cyclic AMP-dependent transcriptional regulator